MLIRCGKVVEPAASVGNRPAAKGSELCLFSAVKFAAFARKAAVDGREESARLAVRPLNRPLPRGEIEMTNAAALLPVAGAPERRDQEANGRG